MPFRKTIEQHRQMAPLLRKAGNERLAEQHDLIAPCDRAAAALR
jgi:hypothetical protein